MSITTIEEFNDLLLTNGDRGNAENINKAPAKLKEEVNQINDQVVSIADTLASTVIRTDTAELSLSDHTTLLNILKGINPPTWNLINRPYAKHKYVYHEGNTWKARRQTSDEPQTTSVDWELIRLYASGSNGSDSINENTGLADIYDVYRKDFDVTEDDTTIFNFDEQTDITAVAVFVDGELLKLSEYNLNTDGIILNTGINIGQQLTMLYNDFIPVNSNILTKLFDIETIEGQTIINVNYNPGYEIVYRNGIVLGKNKYTTQQSGNYITLNEPLEAQETISVQSFGVLVDTKKVFANTYMEINSGVIDLSMADVFEINIKNDTNFQLTNTPEGHTVMSFVIEIIGGSEYLVQWFPNIKWDSGVVPQLSSGRDIYGFYTKDGGEHWRGMLMGKNFK